jgi:hypothetical protein
MFINKFIDKVSLIEARQGKDVVIPIIEARGLRDELSKLLNDLYEKQKKHVVEEPVLKVEIKGMKF